MIYDNFNPKIFEIFKDFSIKRDDGLGYLVCLHHNIRPSYVPQNIRIKVNATGIVKPVKDSYIWSIPLFKDQETAFSWIKTEYIPLFKEKNSAKGGHVRESTARMKKIFAANPEIRKEDVINATRYYTETVDPMYLRDPHYFIIKGKGVQQTSDLLDWIDRFKGERTIEGNIVVRSSKSNTMK